MHESTRSILAVSILILQLSRKPSKATEKASSPLVFYMHRTKLSKGKTKSNVLQVFTKHVKSGTLPHTPYPRYIQRCPLTKRTLQMYNAKLFSSGHFSFSRWPALWRSKRTRGGVSIAGHHKLRNFYTQVLVLFVKGSGFALLVYRTEWRFLEGSGLTSFPFSEGFFRRRGPMAAFSNPGGDFVYGSIPWWFRSS